MKILDVPQRSKEWFEARLGVITGSRAAKVLKSDNLPFLDELLAERLSGQIEATFTSAAMEHGILFEPEAIKAYTATTGNEVTEVGFCIHDKHPFIAVSPDGLIEENGTFTGGVEVKCPNTKTHISYIRMNRVPAIYLPQVIHYFIVIETLQWVDFVSYDPRVKVKPLNIHRVWRHEVEDLIKANLAAYVKFFAKLQKYEQQITTP